MALSDFPMIESLGFLTGVASVWLLARENIWNWPFGLANNALYVAVFLRSGLYGDAGLQLVYISLGVYGWRLWARRRNGEGDGSLHVSKTPGATWMWLIPVTGLAAVGLYFFLVKFTDSTVPTWDAMTTALSLAATFGQAKKYLECWWIWILVDLVYIPLYVYKDLDLTATLYSVFLILSAIGLRNWREALRRTGTNDARTVA